MKKINKEKFWGRSQKNMEAHGVVWRLKNCMPSSEIYGMNVKMKRVIVTAMKRVDPCMEVSSGAILQFMTMFLRKTHGHTPNINSLRKTSLSFIQRFTSRKTKV